MATTFMVKIDGTYKKFVGSTWAARANRLGSEAVAAQIVREFPGQAQNLMGAFEWASNSSYSKKWGGLYTALCTALMVEQRVPDIL